MIDKERENGIGLLHRMTLYHRIQIQSIDQITLANSHSKSM